MTRAPSPAGAAPHRRPVRIDGPLLVFGGPYGNLEATRALFAAADARAIPRTNTICTGDLVAYCADPQAVVDLVRASGSHVVAGNCEEALAAGAADCGCGFPAGSACAGLSGQWYPFAERNVTAASRRWMATLPRRLDIETGGRRLAVVHGGFAETGRFIFASDAAAIAAELDAAAAPAVAVDGVIAGHCGLPFTRLSNGRVWHNAGVVGMPANDGTPRTWYSTVEPTADGLVFAHHALDYDYRAAAVGLRRAGLPAGYAGCLETGIWPGFEVLPPDEHAQRGVPLTPGRLLWRPAPAATAGTGGTAPAAADRWPHDADVGRSRARAPAPTPG